MTEIVYDIAPDAEYWLVNYHTPDQFAQAVAYLRDVVHPNIVVHSNSFLFGRFDGTGFFAQQVDSLAAQGTIWVNSAGNYRLNHWEGPWAERRRLPAPRSATSSKAVAAAPARCSSRPSESHRSARPGMLRIPGLFIINGQLVFVSN